VRNSPSLGLYTLIALVIGNMLGAGVFTTSGFALADLGSPVYVLLAWFVGGLLALCGAVSYGALSRLMPVSGGEYFFLSRAVHPLVGFVAGWISLWAGFTAAIAFAAVVGHVFPVFLGFRGGKGVATALGAFIALAPIATVSSAAVFILLVVWKRYVSLASVIAVGTFPLWAYTFGQLGWMTMSWLPVGIAGVATAVVVLTRHRANLHRIRAGTESRIGENLEVEER